MHGLKLARRREYKGPLTFDGNNLQPADLARLKLWLGVAVFWLAAGLLMGWAR